MALIYHFLLSIYIYPPGEGDPLYTHLLLPIISLQLFSMAPKRSAPAVANDPGSSAGSHGGRGRGRGHVRGRGRGVRGAHQSTDPEASPPSSPEKLEFLVEVISTRRHWVNILDSFAQFMMAS